jgi:mannosyltransferase
MGAPRAFNPNLLRRNKRLSQAESFDILTTSPPTLEIAKSPAPSAAHRRFSPTFYIAVAITIVAALLRFCNLGKESIWHDEGFSISVAHLSWHALWRVVSTSEANMALYYLLLHVWTSFGESEVLVRSLSAVAGLLTLPVFFVLGRRMFNSRVALIASFLLATNAFHIYYSQEARGYSLAVLLTTLSSLFFIRGIESRTRWDWVWYVLTATLASYSHFFAWLIIGAQWISLFALSPHSVPWRKFVASAVSIGCLCLPLFAYILRDNSGHLDWASRPTFSDFFQMLGEFAGLRFRLLGVVFSAACFAAVFFAAREWRSLTREFERWHFVFLLSWFVIPVLLTFGISQWKPIYADRFLIVCLPAFLLLVSVGLSRISPRWAQVIIFLVIAIWTIRCLWRYETEFEKEDWRSASAYVLSQETRADGLFFYLPFGQTQFNYYVRREGRTGQVGTILHPERNVVGRAQGANNSLEPNLAEHFPRIWLIETHFDDQTLAQKGRAIQATLASQYSEVSERTFRGVDVFLYSGSEQAQARR